MLEVGKLYSCSEYYLMLYPDKEAAVAVDTCGIAGQPPAGTAYWTRKLGKPILYVEKNVPLLVLNTKGEYIEVLAGDRKGWIVYRDWLEIKELVNAAA